MMWKAKTRIKVLTGNTTIYDTDFSGWLAVNNGNTDVTINRVTVPPGKGLDYTNIRPYVLWDSPIQFIIPAGGEVVLQQLIYKDVKQKSE